MALAKKAEVDDIMPGGLRDRITVFLDDLQNFNESALCEEYCEDSTFMSSTYFTVGEKEELLSRTIRGKSLRDELREVLERKAACDGEICSSHDLKPIYERYFGFCKSDMRKHTVRLARESWVQWRTSTVASEAPSTSGAGRDASSVSDERAALTKKLNKAKLKNRRKDVARLEKILEEMG